MIYGAEFVHNAMTFTVTFIVEDGMPADVRVYNGQNEVIHPTGPLYVAALGVAARKIIDGRLTK